GNFISSNYYTKKLPGWLENFNEEKKADSLLKLIWNLHLPEENYKNNIDDAPWEKIYKGKNKSTFPYDLGHLRKENGQFALLKEVPFGNSLLTELAIATIEGEDLGQRAETDFLSISYSSTDYV